MATHAKRIALMTRLLKDWRRRLGDPPPLVTDERDPLDFDYNAVVREPDRHQPTVILHKYFD
ncbi:MAG: hypothetical protein VYE73_05075 [Acidobacteriota bacterium]|nr:hypothetical protein [Acidobacteriota bacterium]